MSLKLACPRCRHVQFCDESLAGQAITCAKCGQAFRVPRAAEQDVPEAPSAGVPWPLPSQLQARELPATFAPPEIGPAKVVPLPDAEPRQPQAREPSAREPLVRGPRARGDRLHDSALEIDGGGVRVERRSRRPVEEASGGPPWGFLVSLVAFVLLLFAATAGWFLLRDDRPPQPKGLPPFAQQQPPFVPPPQFAPPPRFPNQQMAPWWQNADLPNPKGAMDAADPLPNEQFITVKLKDGKLRQKGNINGNDPVDPLRVGCHRKVYLVELEAKRRYTIEMHMDPPDKVRRNAPDPRLDPYVRIEDGNGKVLDFNDDIVPTVDLDSRIEKFLAPAKGIYRIVATSCDPNQTGNFLLQIKDEDMGEKVVARPLTNLKLPDPAPHKQPLALEKTERRDLKITTVLKSPEPLVDHLSWSADGKAFFALDESGVLRRLSFPGFVEEARLEMGQETNSLALCKQGLVAGLPKLQEAWLIDPQTLQVKKQISAPGLAHVTAAPVLDLVFVAAKAPANPLAKDVVMLLDAAHGVPLRQYDAFSKHLTVTPDGKFLFAAGSLDRLVRYAVRDTEVTLDQESAAIANQTQGVFVSPDSKFVCLSCKLGNNTNAVNPPAKLYSVFIYAVEDLTKPAFTICPGEEPRGIGFDPKAHAVFGSNHEKQFMEFSERGLQIRAVDLPGADLLTGDPLQFLAHPDGYRVLVRTSKTIYGVELPREEKK